jgi:cytochrome c554/c'-like protein
MNRVARYALLAVLVLAMAPWSAAVAADTQTDAAALSDADRTCLGCHSQQGMTKTFGKGESVALHVAADEFARSVHAPLGCAACHSEVDLKTHPGGGKAFATAREFSLAQAGACRQCHEDAFKQHEGSVHAARISQGNPLAPTCTGCHGFHTVTPKTAYQTCVTCHATALGAHRQWLPNATLHHEVVSCAACHAPAALRMVDLRLFDGQTKTWGTEKAGEQWFEKLARSQDADGNGLDPVELDRLVKAIQAQGKAVPDTFRGRIELRTNVEAHRLADKSKAIKACDSCHRAGAEPFQNVTVSITGPDGRPVRHAAQQQVLASALAVASLPEFYAIGGTRSTLLDVLFVLALLGGAGFPLGHMAVRWMFRKYRDRKAGGPG